MPINVTAVRCGTWDTIATMGWLAGITDSIRLLSHVYVPALRHPLAVAKAFATLDVVSGGRVVMGVGAGHVEAEFDRHDPGDVVAALAARLTDAPVDILDVGDVELRDLAERGGHHLAAEFVGTDVFEGPLTGAADGGAGMGADDCFRHVGHITPRRYRANADGSNRLNRLTKRRDSATSDTSGGFGSGPPHSPTASRTSGSRMLAASA